MKKKLFIMVLAMCMAFSLLSANVLAADDDAVIEYQLGGDSGTLKFDMSTGTITEYVGEASELVVPGVINGRRVEHIGDKAFYFNTNIVNIILPDGLLSIGNNSFANCRNLESINIPYGVTDIGTAAFDITKLKSIEIPNTVQSIGVWAFARTDLEEVTIPESITVIPNCCFYQDRGLHTVNLPKTVNYIGVQAFCQCSQLKNITIPDGVTYIGASAFNGTAVEYLDIPDSVQYIGGSAFYGTPLKECVIPEGIEIIYSGLFNGCDEITSVTIPQSVKEIGNSAFSHCSRLADIVLPRNLESIGSSAFSHCTALKEIEIPDTVKEIGGAAFIGCPGLEKLTFPKNITLIPNQTCQDCSGLTEVVIQEGVTNINPSSFSRCSSMHTLYLPKSLTYIGRAAFNDCTSLSMGTVYYAGSEEDWNKIEINDMNDCFSSANIVFNYTDKAEEPDETPDLPNPGLPEEDPSLPEDDSSLKTVEKIFDNGLRVKVKYPEAANSDQFNVTLEFENTGADAISLLNYKVNSDMSYGQALFEGSMDKYPVVKIASGSQINNTISITRKKFPALNEAQTNLIFMIYDGTTLLGRIDCPMDVYYRVQYYANDGVNDGVEYVKFGDLLQKKTLPNRADGSKFDSWHEDDFGGEDWFANHGNSRKVTSDLILYAVWKNSLVFGVDTFSFVNSHNDFFGGSAEEPEEHDYSTDYLELLRDNTNRFGYANWAARNTLNSQMRREWGGSCFGMSAVLALNKIGELDIKRFQPDASCLYDLSAPKNNSNVRSLINYYYLTQFLPDFKDITDRALKTSEMKNISQLWETVTQSNGEPVVILFNISSGTEYNEANKIFGHAVVGYDWFYDDSDLIVKIWDPNNSQSPNNSNELSILRIKSDFSAATFENMAVGNKYDGYYEDEFRVSRITGAYTSSYYNKCNIEDLLPKAGREAEPVVMSLSDVESYYLLYTNYSNFVINCSDNSYASVVNGVLNDVESNLNDWDISIGRYYNSEDSECNVEFILSGIDRSKTYTITPEPAVSNVNDQPLREYSTILLTAGDVSDGFYAQVDAETTGDIIIFGDGRLETRFDEAAQQSLTVVRNDVTTPWYAVTASGKASSITAVPSPDQTYITSADTDTVITITAEDDYNSITFENVPVGSTGVTLVERNDNAVLLGKDDETIDEQEKGYSLIFYSMGGTFIDTQANIPKGGKAVKPADPEREGYKFAGWYTSADYIEEWDFDTPITANTKIYAKWEEIAQQPVQPAPETPDNSGGGDSDSGDSSSNTSKPSQPAKSDNSNNPAPSTKLDITEIFSDIKNDMWYTEAVTYVYEHNLMNGEGANLFNPNGSLNRAMLVTILYRMEGEPTAAEANKFTDVAAGQWYTDAVIWANANGIVNGYENGTFAPIQKVSREEMAAMLARYAAYKGYDVNLTADLSSYADYELVADWAKQNMQWANAAGLIKGDENNRLNPQGSATRAEAATILMRFLQNIAN